MELRKVNKKAQGFEWGTILAGVVALVILVLLLFFIMKGGGSWGDFIGNIFGGSSVNVANVVIGCNSKCSANIASDYCTLPIDVVFVKGGKKESWTCQALQGRVPRPEGLNLCDIQCSNQVVKCADLVISNCQGLDSTKCTINWVASANVVDYQKNQLGVGKTYIAIDDVTGYVTDVAEVNQQKAQGMVCVKLVKP